MAERKVDIQGVNFGSSWSPDPATNTVAVLRKEGGEANYAVRIEQGENGPKLTLLTKQATDKGGLAWMPSKTQCVGDPEKVIREAEYREARISKNWKLDTNKGVIVHKDGIFAARSVVDEKGKNTGKLELLTKQGPEGKKEWRPAKNPCVGTPEHVFQQTSHRQHTMNEIEAFRKKPIEYVKGKDSQGNMIFKHPGNRHAVRIHSMSEDGKTAKLEVLTTQFNAEQKRFEWMPAKKPFVGTPSEAYSEIGNREYGLAKGKAEEAARVAEATKIDKELAGRVHPVQAQDGQAKTAEKTPAQAVEAKQQTPEKTVAPKKEAPAKSKPAPAKAKAPKRGRGM